MKETNKDSQEHERNSDAVSEREYNHRADLKHGKLASDRKASKDDVDDDLERVHDDRLDRVELRVLRRIRE